MSRLFALSCLASAMLFSGCASPGRSAPGLSAISVHVERATQAQRRAVRKPLRDERSRAMRRIAEECDALLAATDDLEDRAQLVSASGQQLQAAEAVAGLRHAARDLKLAATRRDPRAVRSSYLLLTSAYAAARPLLESP